MSTEYGRLILRNTRTARRFDHHEFGVSTRFAEDRTDRILSILSACGWIGCPALILAVLFWPQ